MNIKTMTPEQIVDKIKRLNRQENKLDKEIYRYKTPNGEITSMFGYMEIIDEKAKIGQKVYELNKILALRLKLS